MPDERDVTPVLPPHLSGDEIFARLERARRAQKRRRRVLDRVGEWLKRGRIRLRRVRRRERRENRDVGKKVLDWCVSKLGTAEVPDGSNWGHPVQDWIQYTGYGSAVPWCGCFAAYVLCKVGGAIIPSRIRLGFSGYIVSDAQANRNGLAAVPLTGAVPGKTIIVFTFSHIAILYKPYDGSGYVETIDGNTSPNDSGSQNDGGTVARKRRPISQVAIAAKVVDFG